VTRLSDLARDENGQVTAFVVVIATAVLMFAGLLLDGGQALAAKVRAIGEAQEAARAGAQAIDLAAYRDTGTLTLTPDHAVTLAQRYLAATGHAGTVRVTGNTVIVTVTLTQPTALLRLVGVGSLTVTSTGSAQPQRGITAPEP
jgi:hypothetical protein